MKTNRKKGKSHINGSHNPDLNQFSRFATSPSNMNISPRKRETHKIEEFAPQPKKPIFDEETLNRMNKAVLKTGVDKSKLKTLKAQSKANEVNFIKIVPKKDPLDTGLKFDKSRLLTRDSASSHFEENFMEKKSRKALLDTGLDQSTLLAIEKSRLKTEECPFS